MHTQCIIEIDRHKIASIVSLAGIKQFMCQKEDNSGKQWWQVKIAAKNYRHKSVIFN
ncbi:hypothetical protein SPWS13_4296 [Shewanella putrefaciens]|nr:hypothetical protein SPWS13_4296 [Shewanella putrefaciens]